MNGWMTLRKIVGEHNEQANCKQQQLVWKVPITTFKIHEAIWRKFCTLYWGHWLTQLYTGKAPSSRIFCMHILIRVLLHWDSYLLSFAVDTILKSFLVFIRLWCYKQHENNLLRNYRISLTPNAPVRNALSNYWLQFFCTKRGYKYISVNELKLLVVRKLFLFTNHKSYCTNYFIFILEEALKSDP